MSTVKLYWDPAGQQLNALGGNTFLRITDGDTPFVSTAIRMLSIDTPEVHYPGTTDPAKHDARLQQLAEWIKAGQTPVSEGLATHLTPKLATGKTGTLQKQQGVAATQALQQLMDDRLTRPNGKKRELYLSVSNQPFDQYGRLLAYVAPSYSTSELETMTTRDRATFNLLMVDSGWAASFLIYPSLPKYSDLVMFQAAAKDAQDKRRGIWADAATLTGYEFRMCYKLWDVTDKLVKGEKVNRRERGGWVDRYCVDMTTREIFEPADYYRVAQCNRVFLWPADVNDAVSKLNLTPPV